MQGLTAAQAAVYDRQLRVWGVDTQRRLTAAKILIAGLQGVAAEVAKNIVLAGVGQLTLLDTSTCADAAPANFLVPAAAPPHSRVAQQSAETLQHMNPLVTVSARSGAPEADTDLSYLQDYQVVLLAGANLQTMLRYDQACTSYGVAFYTVTSRGSNSYFFANLHEHAYTITKAPQVQGRPKTTEAKAMSFPSMEQAMFRSWKGLKLKRTNTVFFAVQGCMLFERHRGHFPQPADLGDVRDLIAQQAASSGHDLGAALKRDLRDLPNVLEDFVTENDELPAVNAVIGGVLANEILRAASGQGAPMNNIFLFGLFNGLGEVETMH